MRFWLKSFLGIIAVLLGASVLWVWAAPLTGPVGRNVVFTEPNTIDIGGYVKGNIFTLHQQSTDPPPPPAGDWYLYTKSTGLHTRNAAGSIEGPIGPGGGGGSTTFAVALVATTANIALSGEQVTDGILTSASLVLVKNQTTPSENGLYVSGASWSRASSLDTSAEFTPGFPVYVQSGTTQGGTLWNFATIGSFTLNTTAVTFVRTGAGAFGEVLANRDVNSGYPALRSDGKLQHTQIGSFAQHAALPVWLSRSR